MSFEINGARGKYDGIVADDSIRYGRNAVENNLKYMEAPLVNDRTTPAPILDFMPTQQADVNNAKALNNFMDRNDAYLASLPPIDFEYRYMPNIGKGKVDGKAVLGAAYEEMGEKELPVKEFENRYLIDDSMTAEPIDINKDGKIDLAEYGSTIVAADVLSKPSQNVTDVDGTINSKGMNALLEYTKKSNAAAAAKLYANVYNTYKLGEHLDSFNPNF